MPGRGRVLVVGATGILRPAAERLAGGGWTVLAAARRAGALVDRGPRIVPVPLDVTVPESVAEAVRVHRPEAAIVYARAAPEPARALLSGILSGLPGPVVEVLTSRWAAPSKADESPPDLGSLSPTPLGVPLLLGWVAGERRWHTPEEVSAAAVETFEERRPRVLGTVRPWRERPS